jgi:hypothetical protein
VAGFVISPYDFRIGVRSNDVDALDRVRREHLLSSWKVRTTGSRRVEHLYSIRIGKAPNRRGLKVFHLLYAGGALLKRTDNLDELFDFFDMQLHVDVALSAAKRTFVHAAAVGFPGGAIIVPGRSHSGKSTLAKALADAGGVLYSDEFAVIDETGRVHPYPRPLSLRQKSGPPLRTPVEQHGGGPQLKPLRVAAVVLTRYERGALFRPATVTPGEAVLGMVENAPSMRMNSARDLRALGAVALNALRLRGPRGPARAAARVLLRILSNVSPRDVRHQASIR